MMVAAIQAHLSAASLFGCPQSSLAKENQQQFYKSTQAESNSDSLEVIKLFTMCIHIHTFKVH